MDSNNWRQPSQTEQPPTDGASGDWRSQLQDDSGQRIVNKISAANGSVEAGLISMEKEIQELRAKIDQSNLILLQALDAFRTGKISDEFFLAAQSALCGANSQVVSASSSNNTCNGLDHVSSSCSRS